MFNYPQHGTVDHIQGQGDRLHIASKGVQKIFFYKFRQFCPFRWQGFLGWLMNYEEDTAWLVYSCQVIHTCLIVTQTTTIFFFHRDAQHQLCEVGYTGHILYNASVNIGLLPTKRITMGNKEQTLLEYR